MELGGVERQAVVAGPEGEPEWGCRLGGKESLNNAPPHLFYQSYTVGLNEMNNIVGGTNKNS